MFCCMLNQGNIMKLSFTLTIALSIFSAPLANAYNNTPLSPSWFKNVYENVAENRNTVWRGYVKEVLNPTQILIQNLDGKNITVNLIHLTEKKDASSLNTSLSLRALDSLIGKKVYVLGSPNKKSISAKIIDAVGNDINLSLVESGAFDINTTTLHFKYEKQQYINAVNNAKASKTGIWN